MTKTTLALFVGAACASAWWAVGCFLPPSQSPFVLIALVLSAPVLVIFVQETVDHFDK